MAYTPDECLDFISAISDNHADAFKMAPYYADLNKGDWDFSDDEDFATLMEVMLDQDKQVGFTELFQQRYAAAIKKGMESGLSAIEADMRDNYVMAGLALKTLGLDRAALPVIPWAAFNKSKYPGLPGGEFALVRMLEWAGFDINAREPATGRTALHYFSSMNVAPYSNARAVTWLLAKGADPSVADKNGDTPLIYLGGSVEWTQDLSLSFIMLGNHDDTDLFAKANDGSSVLTLMKENDPKSPNPERQALIAQLESMQRSMQEREELEGAAGPGNSRTRSPLAL